jgi:pyrroline-5-carboxylate reductase
VKGRKIKIGFIGGGNMGEALMAGLIAHKVFKASEIGVFEPDAPRLKRLKSKYKIVSFPSNPELVRASETLLLAVKPQQMGEVLEVVRKDLTPGHLVLSIAAGLDMAYFEPRMPPGTRLIRIMPNLASMIGEGAAALYASPHATPKDKILAKKIFTASGKAVFVDREELLDVVTAVSGSGPAFCFLFLEALIAAGAARGLPAALGRELAAQTLVGAARMAERSKEALAEMIARVASKGGTTEAGLKILSDSDFRELIDRTIGAAAERAKELRCTS